MHESMSSFRGYWQMLSFLACLNKVQEELLYYPSVGGGGVGGGGVSGGGIGVSEKLKFLR